MVDNLLINILRTKRPSYNPSTYKWAKELFESLSFDNLHSDNSGNYWTIVEDPIQGSSTTCFTSHYDTVHREFGFQKLRITQKEGDTWINAGKNILGADDGAGMWLMIKMIEYKVPGLYIFFADEECGGIGSQNFDTFNLKGIKTMISFDRKGTNEVVVEQLGMQCASNEAGEWLANSLNESGLDYSISRDGIFTDSANFTEDIDECFNLSVGYYNEHTDRECLNFSHLERLLWALVSIPDWSVMPIKRDCSLSYGNYNLNSFVPNKSNSKIKPTNSCSSKEDIYNYNELYHFIYSNTDTVVDFLTTIGVDVYELESFNKRFESQEVILNGYI